MIEQEIKIAIADRESLRERLRARGGRLEHADALEDNLVLDEPDGRLAGSERLLRVRRYGGRTVLTFKGPARWDGGVKSRTELETEVADGDVLLALLACLELTPVRRYQKRREVWRLAGVEVALDLTPLGCFIELEGEAGAITRLAGELGLDVAAAARGSYLELWEEHRRRHPGIPRDMVLE